LFTLYLLIDFLGLRTIISSTSLTISSDTLATIKIFIPTLHKQFSLHVLRHFHIVAAACYFLWNYFTIHAAQFYSTVFERPTHKTSFFIQVNAIAVDYNPDSIETAALESAQIDILKGI